MVCVFSPPRDGQAGIVLEMATSTHMLCWQHVYAEGMKSCWGWRVCVCARSMQVMFPWKAELRAVSCTVWFLEPAGQAWLLVSGLCTCVEIDAAVGIILFKMFTAEFPWIWKCLLQRFFAFLWGPWTLLGPLSEIDTGFCVSLQSSWSWSWDLRKRSRWWKSERNLPGVGGVQGGNGFVFLKDCHYFAPEQ